MKPTQIRTAIGVLGVVSVTLIASVGGGPLELFVTSVVAISGLAGYEVYKAGA